MKSKFKKTILSLLSVAMVSSVFSPVVNAHSNQTQEKSTFDTTIFYEKIEYTNFDYVYYEDYLYDELVSFDTENTIVDFSYTAVVNRLNENQNELVIEVTEYLFDGSRKIFSETHRIRNNSSGYFQVGEYAFFIKTQGNTQIREMRLISNPHFYDEITDYEVKLLEQFSFFNNGRFELIADIYNYLDQNTICRLKYINESANLRVDEIIDYITNNPISRNRNAVVVHNYEFTEEGLFITQYQIGTIGTDGSIERSITVAKLGFWAFNWGVRWLAAPNAFGAIGATFSIAGTVFKKNQHLGPVFTAAGHSWSGVGALASSNFQQAVTGAGRRVREMRAEFRSTQRNIPASVRPTAIWWRLW